MFANYFKTTLRNLWKNKTYSFLNIFGLAIGIACAGSIFLWVESEVTYDNFHVKRDRLYLIMNNTQTDAATFTHSSTPGLMAPAMQAELPGIAQTCRVRELGSLLINVADKPLYSAGKYVDSSFFDMFTFPFVQGSAKTAFAQLHSLVITEKAARKFFGTEKNVVGRTLRVDNEQDYVVSGVLKDLPLNSSFRFEWLAPFEIFYQGNPWTHYWDNAGVDTYVELKPGVQPATVNKLLYNYMDQKVKGTNWHLFLYGMPRWRLYNQFRDGQPSDSGRILYVRLFSVIAWIILFIACINFMNLATARSEKKAREVGVRKVMGADKKGLILRFMGEALCMAFIAAMLALVVMALALPAFNALVQKQLVLGLNNPLHWAGLLAITLLCGLVAGSYPSLYLSAFNPVAVLKGWQVKTGNAVFIRKGLVVLQFTVSIMLIIGTIIIYQQIQHAKTRNLGFNKNNLLQVDLQGDMVKNFAAIQQELINTGAVQNAALADHETISSGNNTTAIGWPGKDPNSHVLISQRIVSHDFLDVAGMHLIAGRNFNITDHVAMTPDVRLLDSSMAINVVITQSLEKILGNGSAVGKVLTMRDNSHAEFELRVTGVVADYVYGNMYGKPDPVIFFCIPQFTSLMYIRIKDGYDIERALDKIAGVMKRTSPAYPFEYRFVDDQFNAMFMSETLISRLSRVFAALAIVISCLGLFGLAAYTAERRTREIGIRKVLGASVFSITSLLSRDFIRLVAMAALIAFPLAWWVMFHWLQNYNYRITINWWVFAVAGILALAIALCTIGFQSVKAALANPAKSLKSE